DLAEDADVYLLSREAAKLGHRNEGLRGRCPGCGARIATDAKKNASRRLRCPARIHQPRNVFAELTLALATVLAPGYASSPLVQPYVPHRLRDRKGGRVSRTALRSILPLLLDALTTKPASLHVLFRAMDTIARITGATEWTAGRLLDLLPRLPEDARYLRREVQKMVTQLRVEGLPPGEPDRHLLRALERI
ncbi:MAG: hypothetical protein GY928_40250, partial [Colwellia sp.]|nr:hypothetical protein [Colwellia sp.]